MAMLASMELRACHADRLRVAEVWTFGMPRAGNAAFAERYAAVAAGAGAAEPMWRVVHAEDLVPQLPPYWLGFRHPPLEIYYPTKTASFFQTCPPDVGALENPGCSLAASHGTMEDHHAYLGGAILTDENKVPEECISAAAMAQKQSAGITSLVWTALVALAFSCGVSCFCGRVCCGGRCWTVLTPRDRGYIREDEESTQNASDECEDANSMVGEDKCGPGL